MTAAKKKTTAKRTVKYAAKAQNSATQTAAKTAHKAVNTASAWTNKGVADWQKGAAEWAKQSASLYQNPFAHGDTNASAEGMMKMGTDMMNQLFGQAKKGASSFSPASLFPQAASLPKFDAAAVQDKITKFARESAEQLSKSGSSATRAMNEAMSLSRENSEAAVEVSNVAIAVSKEIGAELIGYLNKTFSQNVELSKQVLSCRTLNDMFDLSGRFVKSNLDNFFSESVKISELMFQSANSISEPVNERISDTTERLSKAMAA